MISHISIDGIEKKRPVEYVARETVESIEAHMPESGRIMLAVHPDSKHKNSYSVMIKATSLNKDAIVHCNDENVFKAIKTAQKKIIFQLERLRKKVLRKRKLKHSREEWLNWAG